MMYQDLTIGMRVKSLAWEKTFFGRLKLASEAYSPRAQSVEAVRGQQSLGHNAH
jgi:hypothetical protein